METPTLDQFRECLEILASKPPRTKSRVLRSLLPNIEIALASGKTIKQIWQSVAYVFSFLSTTPIVLKSFACNTAICIW